MSQDPRGARSQDDGVQASRVKPEKVRWLWRDRFPEGKIVIVAGKPDQGKGLLAAHVAAELSASGHNVLYSAIEDDAATMTRPRLEAAGADLDRVLLWRFWLPDQMRELEAHVVKNNIRLVVMDPFAGHLTQGISRHSDRIREILTPLTILCERTRVTVLITEHALKRVSPHQHPLSSIGGASSGLPAVSRMAYVFGVDPDDSDRRLLCCVKSNLRETPKALVLENDVIELDIAGEIPSLVVTDEIEYDARRLLSTDEKRKPGRKPEKRAAAAEWLVLYLANAGEFVKAGDVLEDAKQNGFTVKTIRNAAEELQIVKDPPGGGRSCKWGLPDAIKQALGMTKDEEKEAESTDNEELVVPEEWLEGGDG